MTTTYTYSESSVSDSQIGHKKGITIQQGRALRDNPKAMAQGATDSAVIFAGWHPYNLTEVGGSETGVIYDGAVDGATSPVDSPDFEDGFEYAFVFKGIDHNQVSAVDLQIALYRETDAAFFTAQTIATAVPNVANCYGILRVPMPRLAKEVHPVNWYVNFAENGTDYGTGPITFQDATIQKITRARFTWSAGSFEAGTGESTITMLRRREYLTG